MSQILLNDASERGQKIKVVATLRNGLSAKEFANFIASERHEKVRGVLMVGQNWLKNINIINSLSNE